MACLVACIKNHATLVCLPCLPVHTCICVCSLQKTHATSVHALHAGIRSRSEPRSRERVHNYTVWEPRFRNSLCRTGQYFVGRPARRSVTEQYEQPIYDLQPEHIKVTCWTHWHPATVFYTCLLLVQACLSVWQALSLSECCLYCDKQITQHPIF